MITCLRTSYVLAWVVLLGGMAPCPAAFGQAAPARSADLTIRGKVLSDRGETLPGVSVLLQGSSSGTVTDAQGTYSLSVPNGRGTLVFSYIGLLTQEIAINGRTSVDVTLVTDAKSLNEVVVVGYGTQQRRDLTGAVASVRGKELANLPIASANALLQGRAAGVQVTQNSGAPGAGVTVRIRGTTSINAGNSPLYVVDGVPLNNNNYSAIGNFGSDGINPLAAINPNDIESIEVLKDASASAIYGARAANGVVLITTKRGREGQTTFSLGLYRGVTDITKKVPLLNAAQQYDYIRNAADRGKVAVDQWIEDGKTIDTDWQNELFRPAPVANYDLAMRGGNGAAKYAISLGYFDQQGVVINTDFKRLSGRINVDYAVSPKFKIGNSLALSRSTRNRINEGWDANSVLGNALRKLPFSTVYDANGAYVLVDGRNRPNPVAQAAETRFFTQDSRLTGNLFGEYELIKGLSLRVNVGMDYITVKDDRFVPSTVAGGETRPSSAGYLQDISWINENLLSYNRTFGKHSLSALVGYSQQESNYESLFASGSQGASNNLTTINAAALATGASTANSSWGISSLSSRVNYTLADKYLLGVSLRRDGSSRFGAGRKYGVFPSVSAGWRLSDEAFLKNQHIVSDLKLRGSVGVTGNQEIGDFRSQGLYGTGRNYLGRPGIAPNEIPNPDLGWESTTQYNAGVDLTLLNRITLIADYYVKNTNELLLQVELPSNSGFTGSLQNIGSVQNRGFEFNLNTRNFTGDFRWTTDLNMSFNRNRIVRLATENQSLILTSAGGAFFSDNPQFLAQAGQPIGTFYGYVWTGRVFPTNEANVNRVRDGSATGPPFEGGDMEYVDLNGDNIINGADRAVIGNANPRFTGGLTNTFSYKGVELSVLLQGSQGNQLFNQTRLSSNRSFVYNAATTEVLRSWRQPGDVTDVPRGAVSTIARNGLPSTRWIEDGSYLRFKTVTLAYTLPGTLVRRVGVKSARVYGTAQNLFTCTKYTGLDPEVNYRSDVALLPGIDLSVYPQARTVLVGLNLEF